MMWDEKTIGARAATAEGQRARVLNYVRECMRMVMPWRLDGFGFNGQAGFDQLYDATGAIQTMRSASRLQRDLTPPFQRWCELEAGPLVPPQFVEPLNRQLMSSTAILHASLDASAFPVASLDAYADLMIGTGALCGAEGDDMNPIVWTAAPAWALAFETGPTGRVDNVFCKKPYPAWILPQHWKNAAWSEKTRKLIAEQKTDQVEIRQTTYYDPDIQGWRLAIQEMGAQGSPVVWDSARDRTNPWIIFRYWTNPGDPWGRGPVMLALPDIRTANKAVEMILTAAAYQLAPPLMVTNDGVLNPDAMSLSPRALIRVTRTGGPMGPSIAPLQLGSNVDVGQLVLQDQRESITRSLMGTQLPPESGAVRSASEIIERTKQLQYDAGAAFGRLNHEYVPQVIARVLDVLDRKKVAGIRWDELKIDQFIMKVKITSPLARSQNLEDVQTIVQFWEIAKNVGGEEAFLHVANLDDGLPRLAKLMGVPLDFVNDPDKRAALAKAAGQMAAAMVAQQGPQAANDLVAAA